MEFIPPSRLIKNAEIQASREILEEHLPEDVIKLIMEEFYSPVLSVDDPIDSFWVNLGVETGNLMKWSKQCRHIICNSFGKTHKHVRVFKQFEKWFDKLRYLLDCMVEVYYPRCQFWIPINECLENEIKIDDCFPPISDGKVDIGKLFYNYHSMSEYNQVITSPQEKVYITRFVERLKDYLVFLENTMHRIPENANRPVYNRSSYTLDDIKKKLPNSILKVRTVLEKASFIRDIPVNE